MEAPISHSARYSGGVHHSHSVWPRWEWKGAITLCPCHGLSEMRICKVCEAQRNSNVVSHFLRWVLTITTLGDLLGDDVKSFPKEILLHGIQVTFLSEPQVCKGFTSLFRLFSWVSKSFEGPEVLFPVCSHRRSSQNAYSCYFGYCWRSAGFLYSAILNLTKMLFRVVDPVLIQSPQSSSQTPVSTLTSCTIDSTSYLQILCHTYQSFWQSMYFRVRS